MSHIIYYNPSQHDLYIYNSGPTIDPQNYANNVSVSGISYNSNLYIKNAGACGFSFFIDFSGLGVRPRGAPSYGFDTIPGHLPSGVTINPISGAVTYPYALGFYGGYFPNGQSNKNVCYYPGCPTGNFNAASNYNYWNNGVYATVLISPKHFVATSHFVGYRSSGSATITFLGKNNTEYVKEADIKFYMTSISTNGSATYPPGYTFPNINKDLVLFELREELTETEQTQIKVYNFIDTSSIPDDVPYFAVNPQSVVTVRKNQYPDEFVHYYDPAVNQTVPYYGYYLNGTTFIDGGLVWLGDSGTPWFIYNPSTDETCFGGLLLGGNGIYAADPNQLQLFNSLQAYIQDQIGYTIGLVQYSGGSPPTEETIFIDGLTYYLGVTVDPVSGIDQTTTIKYSNLELGFRYSFILVAYNANGYSGYSKIDNFDIPFPPTPDL